MIVIGGCAKRHCRLQVMILEGIITTIEPDGAVNIAPMGPHVNEAMDRFLLRPFPTSQTYQNLRLVPEGVLHVTDDVLLLARAAIGQGTPLPSLMPANTVKGFVLSGVCRYYEFRVLSMDDREPRVRIEAEVVHRGWLRDFFGFNRAKHAVVEAAILATRLGIVPLEEIAAEFRKLKVLVDKTGGAQEMDAWAVLEEHVRGWSAPADLPPAID